MKTKFEETVFAGKYPRLCKHKEGGFVVLFFSESVGVVVEGNDSYSVNYCCRSWVSANDMKEWVKVTGTVTFEID